MANSFEHGIDVSHWQGKINWKGVANSDYADFAILKAGGSDSGFYTDSMFETNYNGAKDANIPVGAYYFVGKDFVTTKDGIADAQRFAAILRGKKFEFPVYVDVETTPISKREGATNATVAFCKYMEDAGYYVGIYGSDVATFKDRLDDSRLKDFAHWVARYSTSEPKTNYGIWQFASNGLVTGIKTHVDINYCKVNYHKYIAGGGFNGY